MRATRQCLFIILYAILCFSLATPAYAAAGSFSIDAQTGADGNVSADLNLSGVAGLSGVQFTVAYDSSKLTLSEAKKGDLRDPGNYIINDSTPGLVHVLWFSSTGDTRPLDANGTTLLSLSFTPKESGNAEVALRTDGDSTLLLIGQGSESVQVNTEGAHDSVQVTATGSAAAAQVGSGTSGAGVFATPFIQTPPVSLAPSPAQSSPSPSPAPAPTTEPTKEPAPDAVAQESAKPESPAATPIQAVAGAEGMEGPAPALTLAPYEAPALAGETESAQQAAQEDKAPPELEVLHDEDVGGSGFPVWLLILFLLFAAGAFCAWFFFIKRKEYGE